VTAVRGVYVRTSVLTVSQRFIKERKILGSSFSLMDNNSQLKQESEAKSMKSNNIRNYYLFLFSQFIACTLILGNVPRRIQKVNAFGRAFHQF
jgi:hypothetical protein